LAVLGFPRASISTVTAPIRRPARRPPRSCCAAKRRRPSSSGRPGRWRSGSSMLTRRRPKDESSGCSEPCRTGWLRRCGWRALRRWGCQDVRHRFWSTPTEESLSASTVGTCAFGMSSRESLPLLPPANRKQKNLRRASTFLRPTTSGVGATRSSIASGPKGSSRP